jgi:hypothetical protein
MSGMFNFDVPDNPLGLALSYFGGSNPVTTGLNVLGGISGLFGSKTKVSSATSSITNIQGASNFGDSGINKPLIDLENPVHIGVLLFALGLGVFIYKKVK